MPWVSRDGFHWADYVVFAIVLILSLFIGSITSFIGKKKESKDDFVMGGKSMSVIPTSLSMVMSFMSAILILGAPAEMYMFGTMYWIIIFGLPIGCAMASIFFVPLLYPLNLISCYKYLELRFEAKSVKVLASFLLVSSQIIYVGIATFSPSTALEAATGFPTWASIICVGVVSTIYSCLGGLKGTIWSSVFQGVIMFGGVTAIAIAGSIKVGGMTRALEINDEWDRVEFFEFDPNPTVRNSFWTLIFGGGISFMSTYGTSQASVQRYCSLPTESKAKQCLFWNIPFAALLLTVTCINGVVMFAYFADVGCDPIVEGLIENPNQLLPHFIMETMAWPGFPGLFVSTLFAGSLSTVAACLSAMASCTWEDFLKWKWNHLSDKKQTIILKVLVLIYGILGTIMAFVTQLMGGHVMQASNSFVGSAMAPLLGLFILGGMFPWANWIGAFVGAVVGLIMPMWISTGAYVMDLPAESLPVPTHNCTDFEPPPTVEPYIRSGLEMFYSISYLWYPAVGMVFTVVVGLLVSLITGHTKSNAVPKKYLIPYFDRMWCCFPEKWRAKCRCGYSEDEDEEIIDGQIASTEKGGVDNNAYGSMANGKKSYDLDNSISYMDFSPGESYTSKTDDQGRASTHF